jgi:S-adenosylmethionine:tRNA ribosyltransferase-isomerase
MNLSDFPDIPERLIAQEPLPQRDAARLMVLDRPAKSVEHKVFRDLPDFFREGEVLVLNDVRVFPARLTAVKPTGGRVKLLLLEKSGDGSRWTSLLTPAQRPGARLALPGIEALVEKKRESGEYELSFSRPLAEPDLERLGRMPLPPYIRRGEADGPEVESRDREYYQTVFSTAASAPAGVSFSAPGAVAAPTAGLHFTPELLDRVAARGVGVHRLRLNVGWGTFRPIRAADYRDHQMMSESYLIPQATAEAVNAARAERRRVWAVGTTAVRALEGAVDDAGRVRPGPGATALYIHPGYRFRAVDVLVTNFHLKEHTPLLLAAAFAGEDLLRGAYKKAVAAGYRFLSYGDGMVVL